MFIDKNLMFHDDQAVTTATEYKGSSIALSTADEMLREGRGEPLEVLIQITATFASGTSVAFALITAPEASLATDETHYTTPAIVTAELVAGKKIRLPLAMVSADTASYFGVMATSVGVHNAGTFSAWVQRAGEDQGSYGAAY